MFIELQSLLKRLSALHNLSGDGGGGSDDDEANDKPKDPFENFDFTRFTSSRGRRPGSGGTPPPSSSNPNPASAGRDKDKDKEPASASDNDPLERARRDDPDWLPPRNLGSGGFRNFGGGNGGINVQMQLPQLPRPSRRAILFVILGILLVALFFIIPSVLSFVADLLWFNEVGQTGVLWTRTLAPLIIFALAFVLSFAVLMINVTVARRFGPTGPVFQAQPDNPMAALIGGGVRFLNVVFILAALFISLILAGAASSEWETILLYFNAAPWTEKETIFNNQIGFYVFDVPFFSFLQGWAVGLIVVCLLAAMSIYFLRYSLAGRTFVFTPAIKTHASVLGAFLLGLFAIGYQISNWKLVYSTRGRVFGASATDVDVQVVANTILTFIVAAAAILLLGNIAIRDTRRGVTLLIVASAIWLVSHIVIGAAFPSLYQNFSVKPNEITKEQPYIANTIKMTREAFGLQTDKDIKIIDFPGTAQLTQQDIQNNPYVQNNARLWDYEKLRSIYDTTQTLRRYYDFKDIDLDRYNLSLNGGPVQETQILISARQLNPANLTSKTWQSLHLQYTHGYGLQASPVNQVDNTGSPTNLITQNFPISSTILPVSQPRIYFGERVDPNPNEADYSVIGTGLDEIDYPFQEGTQESKYKYDGKGGIKLDNFLVKAAFALKLGDFNLLISDAINSNSRLIFRRTIEERIQTLAPFLLTDPDPYMVLAGGRIYWIQDAYTLSDRFPHSAPHTDRNLQYNYIRNSVKIVIDAYDGTTTFYLVDKPGIDPLAQTYANIYPGLFKPLNQLPAELKAHLRYPEYLFKAQTQVYQTYHVTDPVKFYNNEDLWELPTDPRPTANNQQPGSFEPYYLVTRLPGEKKEEFVLINVFQPQNKFNLVSWMAARMDGDNYGQLVTYNFNQSVNIDGPSQFFSRVQALPDFSRSQSLLNQGSSRLPSGPIIIIPLDNSLLYVMPYYLQGSNTALPQLQFVATGANDKVYVSQPGSDDDRTKLLPSALSDVFVRGQKVAASPGIPATGTTGALTPGAAPVPTILAPSTVLPASPPAAGSVAGGPTVAPNQQASIAELVRSIRSHQDLATQAFQAGDASKGNAELKAANDDLARLNQLLGR